MGLAKSLLHRAFGVPEGFLGRLGGRLMSNSRKREAMEWVIGLLGVRPGDRVLEIGYGPGIGLEQAAKVVGPSGFVAGVDPSEVMRAMATERNAALIGKGHVDIRMGTAEALPFESESFDRAFSVNSLPIWPDPAVGLAEIHRVLKGGGAVAIALDNYAKRLQPKERLTELLERGGFERAELFEGRSGVCALGFK